MSEMKVMNRHIWEGWTVGDFIEALQSQADLIMAGRSWRNPFTSMRELERWCADNQPYPHAETQCG